MRRFLTVVALLALDTSAANAASVFMPDAIFDFDSETKTAPSDSSGPGTYGAFNEFSDPNVGPLVVSSSGITGTFSRLGLVPPATPSRFDVKDLDSLFPDSWGGGADGGALDPHFVEANNGVGGSSCSVTGDGTTASTTAGCTYFLAQFDTVLGSASLEMTGVTSVPVNVIQQITFETRVSRGLDTFQNVQQILAQAFLVNDDDPNDTEDISGRIVYDANTGLAKVSCDVATNPATNECGTSSGSQKFLKMQIFAEDDEIFRSILFRGYSSLAGSAQNSNSAYVDNIAVGTGIPEPATVALLGFGTAAAIGLARLRRE